MINDWSRYESIFQHYQLRETSNFLFDENEIDQKKNFLVDRFPFDRTFIEKNESKSKTIDAKTMKNKSKQKKSSTQTKKTNRNSVISIPVPPTAKSRKTNYTADKNKLKSKKNSSTTLNTKTSKGVLPKFESDSQRSMTASETSSLQLSTASSTSRRPYTTSGPSTPIVKESPSSSPQRNSPEPFDQPWNLTEISEFIHKMFYTSPANIVARKISPISSDRVKLRCDKEQMENVDDFIATHNRCIDGFEEYIETLRRQHGIVRDPALDPPTFEPGITIMGSKLKKDPETIDREDAGVIKKMQALEPRKKYALVHEDIGIIIIGGYNLDVKTPAQNEPTTDYVFRFNGQVVKIPTIKPSRIHFGIYTDGEAVYVAGGQTIENTLLDDIQRLDLKSLKWEYVATLANPVAACGMTVHNNKIHIVGGYDILKNHTIVLPDYTIYNLLTNKFEKSEDLPTPRCRSLIIVTNDSIFCVSGLTETRDVDTARKLKICRDILQWNEKKSTWVKVSETPPLTVNHALAFTEPNLEVLLRTFQEQPDGSGEPQTQAYYNFPTNTWHPGKPPAEKQEPSPLPSPAAPSPKLPRTPKQQKSKSPSKLNAGKASKSSQSLSKGKTNKTTDKKKKKLK